VGGGGDDGRGGTTGVQIFAIFRKQDMPGTRDVTVRNDGLEMS
jgi:hypothetical protein